MKSPFESRPDYLICTCMCVMYSDILDAIKAGSKTFEDLSVELLVGTGCNSCVAEIEHVLKEELS